MFKYLIIINNLKYEVQIQFYSILYFPLFNFNYFFYYYRKIPLLNY